MFGMTTSSIDDLNQCSQLFKWYHHIPVQHTQYSVEAEKKTKILKKEHWVRALKKCQVVLLTRPNLFEKWPFPDEEKSESCFLKNPSSFNWKYQYPSDFQLYYIYKQSNIPKAPWKSSFLIEHFDILKRNNSPCETSKPSSGVGQVSIWYCHHCWSSTEEEEDLWWALGG